MCSNMRTYRPILSLTVAQLLSQQRTFASDVLGSIQVTVESNETLSLVTEFNYTNYYVRARLHAHQLGTTVDELVAAQLNLEFDVCFPEQYCPVVQSNIGEFQSTFSTDICGEYCDQNQYQSSLEVLSVCETGGTHDRNACTNFGLTLQASSRAEGEDIKRELGASIASSGSIFWSLLHVLAPEFSGNIEDPSVIGYDISDMHHRNVWYPAWDSGVELCTDDGNEPFYMRLEPEEYLAYTKTDCCRKHFWWNVRGCAAPEERPCPEGYVRTGDDMGWNPLMDAKYYGSYPNIFYPGCQPVISSAGNSRKLERNGMEREAKTRELRHQQNMPKLEALLERQKRMEKLMLSSTKRPPVNNAYLKPRQMV